MLNLTCVVDQIEKTNSDHRTQVFELERQRDSFQAELEQVRHFKKNQAFMEEQIANLTDALEKEKKDRT